MRLRDDATGALLPGIEVEDMGIKTVANDLDNARVTFDRVRLPRSALLNKFADISPEGAYVRVDPNEKMRIEVIGQRLLTGRMVIAQAALLCARWSLGRLMAGPWFQLFLRAARRRGALAPWFQLFLRRGVTARCAGAF